MLRYSFDDVIYQLSLLTFVLCLYIYNTLEDLTGSY